MSGLDTGTLERKEQLLEAVLEQWGAKQGSDCHVATSQRRDVPTSRRPNVTTWGQQCRSQQVETSRRQLEICTSSFKVRRAQKSRDREAYERGHGIPEQSDTDFEEVPGICTVFHFWIFLDIRMMFLILNIFIFSLSMF